MGLHYYNEIDPDAASWLEYLMDSGQIPKGVVDTRSIEDVLPSDLDGFVQHHFFAGIGGWPLALRLAGWPEDRPVWTGSCPCQPFSSAGKGEGFADERHLWPDFFHLIRQCRPAVVLGEQVERRAGLQWLDLVQGDLENEDYAVGKAVLCAAGVGAPHPRQRLYWVAHANEQGLEGGEPAGQRPDAQLQAAQRGGEAGDVAHAAVQRREGVGLHLRPGQQGDRLPEAGGSGEVGGAAPTNGFWADPDWLFCRDGAWRPVEPGTQPVVAGLPRRVVAASRRKQLLKGYGNAVVPQVAEAFIRSLPFFREVV